ncbi:MAG: GAF domain-containing protein [Chloroflexota bacterium]|nr:GAF domain-containing protein [Chloroflexota bacterium]
MFTWVKGFVAAPIVEDKEQRRTVGLLNIILITLLAATIVGTVITISFESDDILLNIGFGVALSGILLWLRHLLYRGKSQSVAFLILLTLWGAITFLLSIGSGLNDSSITGYFLVIVLAALLLSARAAVWSTAFCFLTLVVMLYGGTSGLIQFKAPRTNDWASLTTIGTTMGLTVMLLNMATRSIEESFSRARNNEQSLTVANAELQALRKSLEERVTARTQDLEHQTVLLRHVAEVGRVATTSVRGLDEPLFELVRLVASNFEFEYVALFLLDAASESLVLRAAFGGTEADIGFSIPLNKISGLVGEVGRRQHARVAAIDSTAPASRRSLFLTARTEMALPLVLGERLLGVLDVQSSELGVLRQNDLPAYRMLSEQLAMAIENARLFGEVQNALNAERQAYGDLSRMGWKELLRQRSRLGYRYEHQQVTPLRVGELPAVEDVDSGLAELIVPLTVRGVTIGTVAAHKSHEAGAWKHEEREMVQALMEQLGMALETARLYSDTQQRAAHERLLGEATARMRETLDVQTVLRVALQEMYGALGLHDVTVSLGEQSAVVDEELP